MNSVNIPTTTMTNTPQPMWLTWIVAGTFIVSVIVACFAYLQWLSNPEWYEHFWKHIYTLTWWNPPAVSLTEFGVLHKVDAPITPGADSANKSTNDSDDRRQAKKLKESWCFVGEDLTGRYCLKVPSDHACEPRRLFGSLKDCELVPASHMPAGVVQDGGASMRPLRSMFIT